MARKQVLDTFGSLSGDRLGGRVGNRRAVSTSTSSGSTSSNAEPTTIFGSIDQRWTDDHCLDRSADCGSDHGRPPRCRGPTAFRPLAAISTTIYGDVDGDLADDTITEYSLDGVPHVHSLLASGGQSDAAVPDRKRRTTSRSASSISTIRSVPPPNHLSPCLAIGATSAWYNRRRSRSSPTPSTTASSPGTPTTARCSSVASRRKARSRVVLLPRRGQRLQQPHLRSSLMASVVVFSRRR